MLTYEHRYEIAAPLERVAAFHADPRSLEAITPPPLPMRFLGDVPEVLVPGDEITFRTWVGFVRVRWHARIEALEGLEPAVAAPQPAPPGGPGDDGGLGAVPDAASDAAPDAASLLGFQDRQLSGPFAHWLHQHRFTALPGGGTRVDDRVEARLRRHPLWGPVGLQMWLGLPLLFAYRQAKTRRLLEVGEAG